MDASFYKGKFILLGVVVILLIVSFVDLTKKLYFTSDLQPETIDFFSDEKYQHIILPDTLKSENDNGEESIAYFFNSTLLVSYFRFA